MNAKTGDHLCPACKHPEHPMFCMVTVDLSNDAHPPQRPYIQTCGCDLMTDPEE